MHCIKGVYLGKYGGSANTANMWLRDDRIGTMETAGINAGCTHPLLVLLLLVLLFLVLLLLVLPLVLRLLVLLVTRSPKVLVSSVPPGVSKV
jgi:hypothetical protein